jgi:sulfite exporter TauE/SafE
MGLGTSLFLIAVGAILDFAVSVDTQGFNIHTIGVILMVVGAIGVVLSLVFWSSWGGFNNGGRETVVVDDRPRRRVVRDEIV